MKFQPLSIANQTILTDALRRELGREIQTLDGIETVADRLVQKIVTKAMQGDARFVRLIFAYVEGLPVQKVDVTIQQQAERLAQEVGCTPEVLLAKAEEIASGAWGRSGR